MIDYRCIVSRMHSSSSLIGQRSIDDDKSQLFDANRENTCWTNVPRTVMNAAVKTKILAQQISSNSATVLPDQ